MFWKNIFVKCQTTVTIKKKTTIIFGTGFVSPIFKSFYTATVTTPVLLLDVTAGMFSYQPILLKLEMLAIMDSIPLQIEKKKKKNTTR